MKSRTYRTLLKVTISAIIITWFTLGMLGNGTALAQTTDRALLERAFEDSQAMQGDWQLGSAGHLGASSNFQLRSEESPAEQTTADEGQSATLLVVNTDPELSTCIRLPAPLPPRHRQRANVGSLAMAAAEAAAEAWPVCMILPGDRLTAAVRLVTADSKPIRNRTIALWLNGERVRRTRTDDDGLAIFRNRPDLMTGIYHLRFQYNGSSTLNAATVEALLLVQPIQVEVQVIPPIADVQFRLNQKEFVSDANGIARTTVYRAGSYELELLTVTEDRGDYQIKFDRWRVESFEANRTITLPHPEPYQIGFDISYPVYETYVDMTGNPVDAARIASRTYLSSHGALIELDQHEPHWVQANRIMRRRHGLEQVPIQYSLIEVVVDGANVVNRKQQRYFAESPNDQWQIALIFYNAKFSTQDALFGFPIGDSVALEYPNGQVIHHSIDEAGTVTLDSLARGEYKVQVAGVNGIAPLTPVAITRYQDVPLRVISYLDIGLVLSLGLTLAISLVLIGRPHLLMVLRPRIPVGVSTFWSSINIHTLRTFVLIGITLLLLLLTSCQSNAKLPTAAGASDPLTLYRDPATRPLMLAYYYIWFDPTSWDRAKTDYPLLGRYSSFDRSSMRQHIRWAKAAGIDGFIVSWKGSDDMNERLATLARIAVQEQFQLVLLYQGLDFEREPISTTKIAADLDYFVTTYANHPAFALFGRPVVVWAGTWHYSYAEIADVISTRRSDLLFLASERNNKGYQRLADLVDGNAYYWSSVNPDTYPNYPGKLIEMADLVHEHNGLWFAPAAPGFDARMVGGRTIVERTEGEMLRRQLAGAMQSSPDAVGIISWNEFSENSHIEPSIAHGMRYLEVLGAVLGQEPGRLQGVTTMIDLRPPVSLAYGLPALLILASAFTISLIYLRYRNDLATPFTSVRLSSRRSLRGQRTKAEEPS